MAEEYEDAGTGSSPMMGVLASMQSYTTPEAKKLAREVYDKQSKNWDDSAHTEDESFKQVEESSRAAQAAIRAAREKLVQKRYNKAQFYFAMSQAFGSPTRTGAIGETIGNVSGSMLKPLQDKREWEQGRDKTLLDYDLSTSDIDSKLAQARSAMARSRRESNTKLMQEALRLLGKEIRPGSGASSSMSPFGKIAADEGFPVGSPAFTARVNELYKQDLLQKQQAAGVDVPDANAEAQDLNILSEQFGVPVSVVDPYVGLSTKGRQTAMGQRAKDAEKTLAELADDEPVARAQIDQAERFMELNKGQPTGPISGVLDPDTYLSEAGQEMRKITSAMARNQRQPGEGTISNYDAQEFKRATMAVTKDPNVNKNIGKGIIAVRRAQLDFSRFMQDYYAVNKHVVGAREAWKQYAEQNPIWDPAKPGKLVLNPKRVQYKDYFRELRKAAGEAQDAEGAEMPEGFHPPMAPPSDEMIYDGLTDEDIEAANTPAMADGGRVQARGDGVDDDILTLENAARALLQGGTANFSDEILAGGDDKKLSRERAILEELQARYPKAEFGLEVAGSLPIGLGAGALAHAAMKKSSTKAGKGKAAKTALAIRLLERSLPRSLYGKMAVTGGASGMLGGAGASQDESPVDEILSGGAMGAVLGPLGGMATKGTSVGLGKLIDATRGRTILPASEKVITATARDDLELSDLTKNLRAAQAQGVPATLGDVGGKNTQSLVEGVASKSGEGPARMVTRMESRQLGANERVQDKVNKALAPDEFFSEEEKLKDSLYNQAKPLYEAAYAAHPGVASKQIQTILATPDGKRAAKRALRMMQNDGVPIGKTDAVGMIRAPSLQFLDYVKRGLDGLINVEERTGATDMGKSLRGMRNRLRDELDTVSPEYKAARAQYAGDLEVLDALRNGRVDFQRLQPKQVEDLMGTMSFAEKDAYRSGVAQQLFEKLSSSGATTNPARKIAGSPGVREKLQHLFDKPADYKKFMEGLDREIELFDRSRRTIGRSEAARAREATDEMDQTPLSSAANAALDVGAEAVIMPGMFINHPAGAGSRIMSWVRRHSPTMSQKTANDAAQLLDVSDPKVAADIVKQLEDEAQRLRTRHSRANRAGVAGTGTSALQLNPDPQGYVEEEQ